MQKNINTPLDSLEQIMIEKENLRSEMSLHEQKMAEIWHATFREPTPEEQASPTKKAIAWVTASAGIIDGALLGWKLYKRFGAALKPFRSKKK